MGLFDFLRGGSIADENTSKPFHANQTPSERKDWFARTRPWHKVHPRVVNAIEVALGKSPAMFEVFVHVSMGLDVVSAYQRIDSSTNEPPLVRTLVAGQLCMAAQRASATFMEMKERIDTLSGAEKERQVDEAVKLAGAAVDAWESAVHVDRTMVAAYPGLALFLMLVGRKDDGLKYARQGLDQVRQTRSKNVPFHLSSIASVREGGAMMADLERSLETIVEDLERA